MRIIFFDTETTGIKETDRIVQFAMKERGTDTSQKMLFKPPVPLTPDASSVNHITNEMVADAPPFVGSEMHAQLLAFAADPDVTLCAHNAEFDRKMLAREGIELPHVICTMKLAHAFDKEGKLEKHNLQYLRYFYDVKVDAVAHDALGDVLVMEKVFEVFAAKIPIKKMLDISSKPILLKKWPRFGKYKEQRFALIPQDYLMWANANIEMSEDLAYTVKRWIIHNEKLSAKKL